MPPIDLFIVIPTKKVIEPGKTVTLYGPEVAVETKLLGKVGPEPPVGTPTIRVEPGKYKIAYSGMVQSHPALSTGTVEFEVKEPRRNRAWNRSPSSPSRSPRAADRSLKPDPPCVALAACRREDLAAEGDCRARRGRRQGPESPPGRSVWLASNSKPAESDPVALREGGATRDPRAVEAYAVAAGRSSTWNTPPAAKTRACDRLTGGYGGSAAPPCGGRRSHPRRPGGWPPRGDAGGRRCAHTDVGSRNSSSIN